MCGLILFDSIGKPICFYSYTKLFHYCNSVIKLDIRDCDASGSSFIVQDCFRYAGFFVFPYEVDYCSFNVFEKLCWEFDGDCIESIDCFW